MNWTELLTKEIEDTYRATDGLLALVDDKDLGWKPPAGANWMTMGQLLEHLPIACGFCCRAFLTGDWGMPAGASSDDMFPPAEKMPAAKSVADVRKGLAADKKVALGVVAEAGEDTLATKKLTAPWDPSEEILGRRLLHMVGHLGTHKAQLFYYLKLLGKPVHTGHMYGM